jgi:tRNA/rRNA methyltransferase/tRNA (cytidine32/uridine32-2'-O)-methyltransferase
MILDDIVIVLARPSEPGNTGAVCRAMKNMGLGRLRIAAPEPGIFDIEKLLARAVHAEDIWQGAEYFDSLNNAIADCTISVGTTRRRGQRRKSNTMTPRELASFLQNKSGRAAVVFGNEHAGLDQTELGLCNLASHIPVGQEFPSLNLSHAVQIYAYELFLALDRHAQAASSGDLQSISLRSRAEGTHTHAVPGQWVPMTVSEIDALVKKTSEHLASIGFYKNPGRAEQERFLRDIIARAGLSLSEGRYLCNIMVKAVRLNLKEL